MLTFDTLLHYNFYEVILLTREKIRNHNVSLVFEAILKGHHTIKGIVKQTKLATQTVWNILDDYSKKGVVEISKPAKETTGRRSHSYNLSSQLHCMYFEECPRSYSCIAINIKGEVVHRFDHAKRKDLSIEEDLKILYKKLRSYKLYKNYCLEIVGACSEKISSMLPDTIYKTTRERLVLDFLSEPDKIILFSFEGKLVTSAYSNIIYHDVGVRIDDVEKVLPIDKKYYVDDIYDSIFLALQKYALEKLSKI